MTDPDSMSATERDHAALQGRWLQVGFEEDGAVDGPDREDAAGAITTIRGQRFSVNATDERLLLEGSFTLDASTTPRAITWIDAIGPDAGQPLPASYRLQGDRFVFIAAAAGQPRPTEFRTVPGLTMRSFVRC